MRSVRNFIDGILVEIYDRAVRDEEASKHSETPIYKTVPYVRKRVPNSRDVYDQPLSSHDREKYTELVQAFERGEAVKLDGTPVSEWPPADASHIETLRAAGILTVQALAQMPETGLHRLPPGYRSLQLKAQNWIKQGNEADQLRKENDELRQRIEVLEANQKKPPGRPKKSEAA